MTDLLGTILLLFCSEHFPKQEYTHFLCLCSPADTTDALWIPHVTASLGRLIIRCLFHLRERTKGATVHLHFRSCLQSVPTTSKETIEIISGEQISNMFAGSSYKLMYPGPKRKKEKDPCFWGKMRIYKVAQDLLCYFIRLHISQLDCLCARCPHWKGTE